jgi:hypothetical protein
LPRNLADNAGYRDARFIVLDYNSPDRLLEYLQHEQADAIRSRRLVVYSFREQGPFRMAHAKNMSHRLALIEGADMMVNIDADNFTGERFADYVADELSGRPDTFLWAKMVHHGGEAPRCGAPHRGGTCVLPAEHAMDGGHSRRLLTRGISGRIAVTAAAFLKSGGYDERFAAWGPDDRDFNFRLQRLGYAPRAIDNEFLTGIPHSEQVRFGEYPHARHQAEAYFESVINSDVTIANFGRIGCGTVYRNFDFSCPITLPPLPTRVFGIGMHKTATTSLHKALCILGLDAAHWTGPQWAKTIWLQMRDEDRSRNLERHYAMCDLPFTFLYRELDKAYPGSKFVLTVRDEHKWLQSVRNHWDHEVNPYRASWNSDAFTHKCHQLLYGQKGFNADLFIARYRRHNAEVLEHFRDRREDLLVMDMDAGAGWNQLCSFLGQPIPTRPFPQANRSEELRPIQEDLCATV